MNVLVNGAQGWNTGDCENVQTVFAFAGPQSRVTDPATSRAAQEAVANGNSELIHAIRWYVQRAQTRMVCLTAFEIADAIAGQRWSHATVRSAVSRARLNVVDEEGVSPRGRKVRRYTL